MVWGFTAISKLLREKVGFSIREDIIYDHVFPLQVKQEKNNAGLGLKQKSFRRQKCWHKAKPRLFQAFLCSQRRRQVYSRKKGEQIFSSSSQFKWNAAGQTPPQVFAICFRRIPSPETIRRPKTELLLPARSPEFCGFAD